MAGVSTVSVLYLPCSPKSLGPRMFGQSLGQISEVLIDVSCSKHRPIYLPLEVSGSSTLGRKTITAADDEEKTIIREETMSRKEEVRVSN
jgi:hypothetical protein